MLNERSIARLVGVNQDLVNVVQLAAERSQVPFIITEGVRTTARQAELLARGASQTMNSKHITGRAIDVAAVIDGKVSWNYPYYVSISKTFKEAASELGVRIRWGGDWKSFKDGPHYELM
jgi:peptidoglycan L-alanyl-D-glutamate endopeptidase CwlK